MRCSKKTNLLLAAALVISLCLLVSCAAKPYKETGFLGNYSNMVQTKNFHRFYAEPGVDFRAYKNILVKPVDTSFLPEFKWYDLRYSEEELKELTEFMQKTFAQELGKSYLVIDSPYRYTGKTLVLETALVKLAPVDAMSNVVSSAVIWMPVSKGEIAVEARLIDAESGKTVMRFTDSRYGKENIVNVKDYTKFGHARATIGEWAKELHGIMQMGEAEREGYFGGTFELKAW